MSGGHKPKIAIADYGMGNLFSIKQACEWAELQTIITSDRNDILKSDGVILPGVGAFGDAMDNIKRLGLAGSLVDFISSGKPFLGICLGMQLLMTQSEEFGKHEGLGIFKGDVAKFPSDMQGEKVKVPQVGWNKIYGHEDHGTGSWDSSILKGLDEGEFMYFVHSFYVKPEDKNVILSSTDYEGVDYCSSLRHDNVFAVQFHPEKSGPRGLAVYKNFADLVRSGT